MKEGKKEITIKETKWHISEGIFVWYLLFLISVYAKYAVQNIPINTFPSYFDPTVRNILDNAGKKVDMKNILRDATDYGVFFEIFLHTLPLTPFGMLILANLAPLMNIFIKTADPSKLNELREKMLHKDENPP